MNINKRFSSYNWVDSAFASGGVDLDSIASLVKPMALKLVFIASLLDAQR